MRKLKRLARGWIARRFGITRGEVSLLNANSGFVTPQTDVGALRGLLRSLHPVMGAEQQLIRLGPAGDGGYLLPDDLDGIEACFSPGVSTISGFEADCAAAGMNVFLADKSVDCPAEEHARFQFTKKYVGAVSDAEFMTLDEWVAASNCEEQSDLLLQMDIEGAEYETLLNVSDELLRRFRMVVIEFHSLHQLWNRPFFSLASRCFEKLLKHHVCVHIHPNNFSKPRVRQGLEILPVMEFTFWRRDRIQDPRACTQFPHALDEDNTRKPSVVLPDCWFASSENKG